MVKDIFDSDCLIAFALRTPVGFARIGQVLFRWMLFSSYYDDYEGYANPGSQRQTGPGHHGDDEYEYEIHHFEKFHDESRSLQTCLFFATLIPWTDTKEEDLTHPEDIAHFRKHDEMDAQADYQEQMDQMPIVEQNIPQKFRRY